nr:cystathionine beta-lyase, chloroplastic-like [Arachis hypogaea]XP_029143402.1 cystathionine beta-lyase, chloroplastic-like [Arachis hypogaea]
MCLDTLIFRCTRKPNAIENGPYDYTRSGNPTRDASESLLAKLDKADRALCFTSGMAALSAISHLAQAVVIGSFSIEPRLPLQFLPVARFHLIEG